MSTLGKRMQLEKFFGDIDAKRRRRKIPWRVVLEEIGLPPSSTVFARMQRSDANGRGADCPNGPTTLALLVWLDAPARHYLRPVLGEEEEA